MELGSGDVVPLELLGITGEAGCVVGWHVGVGVGDAEWGGPRMFWGGLVCGYSGMTEVIGSRVGLTGVAGIVGKAGVVGDK